MANLLMETSPRPPMRIKLRCKENARLGKGIWVDFYFFRLVGRIFTRKRKKGFDVM